VLLYEVDLDHVVAGRQACWNAERNLYLLAGSNVFGQVSSAVITN